MKCHKTRESLKVKRTGNTRQITDTERKTGHQTVNISSTNVYSKASEEGSVSEKLRQIDSVNCTGESEIQSVTSLTTTLCPKKRSHFYFFNNSVKC